MVTTVLLMLFKLMLFNVDSCTLCTECAVTLS